MKRSYNEGMGVKYDMPRVPRAFSALLITVIVAILTFWVVSKHGRDDGTAYAVRKKDAFAFLLNESRRNVARRVTVDEARA